LLSSAPQSRARFGRKVNKIWSEICVCGSVTHVEKTKSCRLGVGISLYDDV
jgi:hypothetical protein